MEWSLHRSSGYDPLVLSYAQKEAFANLHLSMWFIGRCTSGRTGTVAILNDFLTLICQSQSLSISASTSNLNDPVAKKYFNLQHRKQVNWSILISRVKRGVHFKILNCWPIEVDLLQIKAFLHEEKTGLVQNVYMVPLPFTRKLPRKGKLQFVT